MTKLNTRNEEVRRALPADVNDVVIEYSSRQHTWSSEGERLLQQWHASVLLTDDNGEVVDKIGDVFTVVAHYDLMSDPFDVLDGESADLGHIAGALFDGETGELDPKLDSQLEVAGSGALIIDSVKLHPEWRGFGLGPLLGGMVIEQLGGGLRFVALQPAPAERRSSAGELVDNVSDDEWTAAIHKLCQVWATLGFTHFKQNVWILDLGLNTFERSMVSVRGEFGL